MRQRIKDKIVLTSGDFLRDNRVITQVVTVVHEDGSPTEEYTIRTPGIDSTHRELSVPISVSRSVMSDESHAGNPPVPIQRTIYTRAQKRWLRERGLWPPFQERAPWKRRLEICDGPCTHFRVSRGMSAPVTKWKYLPSTTTFESGDAPHRTWTTIATSSEGELRYEPGYEWTQRSHPVEGYDPIQNPVTGYELALNGARRRALENVFPKLGYGFSGITFLMELMDLGALAQAALRVVRWLRKPRPLYTTMWSGETGVYEGSKLVALVWDAARNRMLGREVANWGLLYQFGLAPLVSDIIKVCKTVMYAHKQIAYIEDHALEPLVSRCQETLRLERYDANRGLINLEFDTGEEDFLGHKVWNPPNLDVRGALAVPYTDVILPNKAKYHLTVRYWYAVPGLKSGFSSVLMALDSLGLNLSASQVWQGLPFSFLLDWFVPVSTWLSEHVDRKACELEIHVTSCVESVKYEYRRRLDKQAQATLDYSSFGAQPHLATTTAAFPDLWLGKVYRREILDGLPSVTGAQLRMPRGMKWVSAGLLTVQKSGIRV